MAQDFPNESKSDVLFEHVYGNVVEDENLGAIIDDVNTGPSNSYISNYRIFHIIFYSNISITRMFNNYIFISTKIISYY